MHYIVWVCGIAASIWSYHHASQLSLQWWDMNVIAYQIADILTFFNSLFKQQWKYQSSTLLALCKGNPLGSSGFPSPRASIVENISLSWRHHVWSVFPCVVSVDGQEADSGLQHRCVLLSWPAHRQPGTSPFLDTAQGGRMRQRVYLQAIVRINSASAEITYIL